MSDDRIAEPPGTVAGNDGAIGLPAPLRLAPIGNPTLLALDSAGQACSVAIWRAGALAAHRLTAMARGHGERLLPMVAETIEAASLDLAELDAIAVTIGPGGFTGLRIGLAAARGLGLALARPVVGITSFLAVAAGLAADLRQGREILVVLDTKREDLFSQRFDHALRPIEPARLVAPRELIADLPARPVLLAGDGLPLLVPILPRDRDIALAPGPGHADAGDLAALAARLLARGGDLPEGPLLLPEPFYLRAPDVKLPGGSSAGIRLP
jgi:tRNA threonylcarbamoyladenosine biosynthesis protein TsaB